MLVDYDYYLNTYYGDDMETDEFNKLNLRAEDDVTLISNKALSLIEDWETDHVKKAICSQIEYYFINGETYNQVGSSSEKIGNYSFNGGSTKGSGESNDSLSPRARKYLSNTNLLYRGITCQKQYLESC